ncbi:hypothetical protein LCGC14_1996140 [marine sediment metagenome]|uniref:Uncharacterized protein n=1 Tax=marine sediment metagenome TaxID=412755 RepID=A0A0F9F4H4_9ZZZZ
MGKIIGIIGSIFSSGFGLLSGFKWIRKLIRIKNVIFNAIKEGKDVFDESMDIIPVGKELYEKVKQYKFGNTSKENTKVADDALRIAIILVKESHDVVDELKDLKQVFANAKEIF